MDYELVVSDQRGHFKRYPAKILFSDLNGVMVQAQMDWQAVRRRLSHDLKGWFMEKGHRGHCRAPDFWLEIKKH